jgi:tetratricopeptide (TPR) repeat protein
MTKVCHFAFRLGLLVGLIVELPAWPATAQTTSPKGSQPAAPALRKLTGDDAKKAEELEKAIATALKADRWDLTIARAEELLALRSRVQGPKYFETVSMDWRLRVFRRIAPLSKDDRAGYLSATTLTEQADSLRRRGKYAAAQPLYEQALEICRRLLGDDYPDTASGYNNLALNLKDQAKFAAAQPLYEKALAIHRRLLGDDHPDTAANYNNLASHLSAQGKYAAAQPLYEKALEICRRLLGDDHPYTAHSYNNLASNLKAQGNFVAAQPLFERALDIRRRLLGDDHPNTAASYDNVALNLNAQAKYAAAQPLHEKALEIHRRLLSDDHPDTAKNYGNLAQNLSAQGKYAAAQPLYEKALAIHRRLLGDDHPITAISYGNLAENLDAQVNHEAARPLHEKALEIRRRLFSDDHPDTATGYRSLAANLASQGIYAAAQPLYERALAIYRRLLGDDHPITAGGYNDVAVNLKNQGKYAAAQPLYEKALEIRRRLLGDDHPDTAESYLREAANLKAQAKYAQAQPLFEKALEIRRRVFTDDHPDTATSYSFVAGNLKAQGECAAAQPLFEKALEIRRRLLTDEHPDTATSYNNIAVNLSAQGKHAAAQPLFEKALEIHRRLLSDGHLDAVKSCKNRADNLNAQGKYAEARDQWQQAVKILDSARLRVAFTGLERAEAEMLELRPCLAAVLARLGQPAEAWQCLEEDLGRGLLDELVARQDQRLAPGQRARLRELTNELEGLDKLVETLPKDLDQAGRADRFEDLKRQRALASIALGEFQSKLVEEYSALAGRVAKLQNLQAVLPADAALVAWVDVPAKSPNEADLDGEHWGVVIRSRGIPAWVPIAGTGKEGLWIEPDNGLAGKLLTELGRRPGAQSTDAGPLIARLRAQRLGPLSNALAASADGLPPARRLIVLPSPAMAGIPIEALLSPDDLRIVSYAPSATVFKYLREQARPDRHAGLLALGDPDFERPDSSSEPKSLPDRGLLLNVVVPGSNAAKHGLKPGDVLLAYNGRALNKKDDLQVVAAGDKPVAIGVWREGRSFGQDLAPGKLGVVLDARPALEAISANRALHKVLVAARSGDGKFDPLPGTRYEVEGLARLFKADDRPVRVLLGSEASEPELDRLASTAELKRFGYIHLATHGVIDEEIPMRSAVILTQTGLPDPLEQALKNKPVYDGRLLVREIQRGWDLKAELVTLSACETALGRDAGGEGFVGFTQALLMSGARSVCLSLWKVDDSATALLMKRFYANLLGRRDGLSASMPKAEALREAKVWLRNLRRAEVLAVMAEMSGGVERGTGAKSRPPAEIPGGGDADHPYAAPHFWAAFVLAGDPD